MFFGVMLILIFGLPCILMIAIMPERVPFAIDGKPITSETVDAQLILLLLAFLAALGFFAYALHLFRKLLDLFARKILLDNRVISYLGQMGKSLLVGYGIALGSKFLYDVATGHVINLVLDLSLNSALFVVTTALFFMVLSEILLIAKNKVEEGN